MALFGKKKTTEQKNYEKARNKVTTALTSAINARNIEALRAAAAAYPDQWEGDFILALCYDIGAYLPFDREKARAHYNKAEQYVQANGRKDEKEWFDTYMEYYRSYQLGNTFIRLSQRIITMRRAGLCALAARKADPYQKLAGTSDYNLPISWRELFSGVTSDPTLDSQERVSAELTMKALQILFRLTTGDDNSDLEAYYKLVNEANACLDIIKDRWNEWSSRSDAERGKESWEQAAGIMDIYDCLRDYYLLLLGVAFLTITPCPYPFLEIEEITGKETHEMGIQFLYHAFRHGSVCAWLILLQFCDVPDCAEAIARILSGDAADNQRYLLLLAYSDQSFGTFRYTETGFDTPEDKKFFWDHFFGNREE